MLRNRFHYAWVIVAITFFGLLFSAGVRNATSVLFEPLEASFGWDRASVSLAFAISLVFFGLGAPLGGWLIDRYGPRRQEVVRQCFQNVADGTHAGEISRRESGVGLCREEFQRSLCEALGYSRPS